MDQQDLHELAMSYCETIFKDSKVSAKKYMQTYLKAMKIFEKVLDKNFSQSMHSQQIIAEIKENLNAIDETELDFVDEE